jgi:cysteine-rich repeat protein
VIEPVCGNGVVESGEECDDGNTANGDGCSSTCQTEVVEPVCGNGVVESGEECDDGNTSDGDGCSASCQIEVVEPVCGNGVVESGEECDDGNTAGGDGCSASCQIEDLPSTCTGNIVIQSCDSGVSDQEIKGHCISDWIDSCAADARNHGRYVRCTVRKLNRLVGHSIISRADKRAIQSCAVKSNIGKKWRYRHHR